MHQRKKKKNCTKPETDDFNWEELFLEHDGTASNQKQSDPCFSNKEYKEFIVLMTTILLFAGSVPDFHVQGRVLRFCDD